MLLVKPAENFDQLGYQSSPAGLVACSKPRSVIAMKVLVEKDVIPPLRILLKLLRPSIHRPPARWIAQEDSTQTIAYLLGDLEDVHHLARTRWALDFEAVAVVEIERHQGPDDQRVHGHPDWATPVGVSAEHSGVGLSRQVVHAILLPAHVDNIWMVLVVLGDRANAVITQELVLVQHPRQNPAKPIGIHQRRGTSISVFHMALAGWMNAVAQVGHALDAFPYSFHRTRHTFALPWFDHCSGAQRQKANHGPHLEPLCPSVGKP